MPRRLSFENGGIEVIVDESDNFDVDQESDETYTILSPIRTKEMDIYYTCPYDNRIFTMRSGSTDQIVFSTLSQEPEDIIVSLTIWKDKLYAVVYPDTIYQINIDSYDYHHSPDEEIPDEENVPYAIPMLIYEKEDAESTETFTLMFVDDKPVVVYPSHLVFLDGKEHVEGKTYKQFVPKSVDGQMFGCKDILYAHSRDQEALTVYSVSSGDEDNDPSITHVSTIDEWSITKFLLYDGTNIFQVSHVEDPAHSESGKVHEISKINLDTSEVSFTMRFETSKNVEYFVDENGDFLIVDGLRVGKIVNPERKEQKVLSLKNLSLSFVRDAIGTGKINNLSSLPQDLRPLLL